MFRGARQILEAYWVTLGGKPTKETKPATKKRGRQSTGAASEGNSSAKRQKKPGRKSKGASADGSTEPPAGFTEVGEDEWEPPKPLDRAWDSAVQSVDTIEKDDHGELWAYLLWNDKNEDGRFYRSKARLAVCNKACPQRVCIMETHQLDVLDLCNDRLTALSNRCYNSTKNMCRFTLKPLLLLSPQHHFIPLLIFLYYVASSPAETRKTATPPNQPINPPSKTVKN